MNKLPKGLQKKAKGRLQDIWMAARKDAESAFDSSWKPTGAKYRRPRPAWPRTATSVLTFYDFPAEHWKHVSHDQPHREHVRQVRLRTYRTKGCLSRKTAMAMVFKLCQALRENGENSMD